MQLMQRDGGPGVWMQIHFFKNTYIFAFGLCGRLLEDGLHSLANATPCAEKQRTEHYVSIGSTATSGNVRTVNVFP